MFFTVVLVAVLFYVVVAGFSRLIEANSLGTAAQAISDCLAEARQDAMAQNITVEVRIYAAPGGNGFNALQLHARNPDGTAGALAQPVLLPVEVVIDGTAAHSSLVATPARPAPDPADPRLDANTRCFHFLPDGGTDLAPPGPWMLTVRGAEDSDPAHFPTNWACVSLDPVTGRAQIYRP